MATLKIRLEFNPGDLGVGLHKLAQITDEFEKLFRYLAQDVGVITDTADWLARDFYNGSVGCDVILSKPVDPSVTFQYNGHLSRMTAFDENAPASLSGLSPRTLKQFVAVGKCLDTDEYMRMGLFGDGGEPQWKRVERRPSLDLERVIDAPISYYGTVQGRTATWYKASDYFDLRDILSDNVVKCFYPKSLYPQVYQAFKEREAVVHVTGAVRSNRAERRPLEIRVEKLVAYEPLSDDEFQKYYGIAPNMTGEERTADFIERIRRDGDS